MVGSLTVGKRKYAAVEADILKLKKGADRVQGELLELAVKDAEAFAPLAKAYGLPSDTDEEKAYKALVMEEALQAAALVPLEIMEKCCEALDLLRGFAQKGAAIALSDAGCGAVCCRAAMEGASLNVFINTRAMENRTSAEILNTQARKWLKTYTALAEEIYAGVAAKFERS
jgi:formiminotetrahydrofolate cyclodeaminase